MSNLEQKFESFESQVATQHIVLTTALTATNAKLDTLISLFGGAPPTATVTLADVLTAIQATNTVLSSVHTDTISIDQKLLRIRDALNPLDDELPVETHSSVPWLLFRIMDAINPTWPRPTSVPAQPALSLLLALSQVQLPNLASIYSRLSDVSSVLGSPADDTQSILRWIEDIAACACAESTYPSPNTLPPGCAVPYRSTGMVIMPFGVIPGGTSTIAALFDGDLPEGITYSSTVIGDQSHASLHSEDWDGWRIFVSSDLSQFSWDTLSSDRHATNTWIDLATGSRDYVFSVRDTGGIAVTLCRSLDYDPMVCTVYTVPWNNGSPSNLDVTAIPGRTYRATLLNADSTTVVFGYSVVGGGSSVFYMTPGTPYTFIVGDGATISSQYGFAGDGHSPQLEICRMPPGTPE